MVVAAHNEERMLARCLRRVLDQTEPFDEVIVVDNASTDRTAEIAAGFPGVTVLAEKRKGVTYARKTGFDAVTKDVIVRIDADSFVARDYAEQVRTVYASDAAVDAIAGHAGIAELSPFPRPWFGWHYRMFRFWHERSIGVRPVIYGFNGAFTRASWLRIRDMITLDDALVTDDIDLTVSLLRTGHRIVFAPKVTMKAHLIRSLRPAKLKRYYLADGYTLSKHRYGNRRRWVEPPDDGGGAGSQDAVSDDSVSDGTESQQDGREP